MFQVSKKYESAPILLINDLPQCAKQTKVKEVNLKRQ
jgi:hypothetical protein